MQLKSQRKVGLHDKVEVMRCFSTLSVHLTPLTSDTATAAIQSALRLAITKIVCMYRDLIEGIASCFVFVARE